MNSFNWKQLFNPEFYILLELNGIKIGLFVVLFIVFAETGLLAGFFLPGDSLLFLCGIYSESLLTDFSTGNSFVNLILLTVLISVMGVLGNMVGFWFGRKSGDYLFTKEENIFFKKKYLLQSQIFFNKYGSKAIVFARFLPIMRTFGPIIAGVAKMDRKKFVIYNILGSVLWSFSIVFSGHYLYEFFLYKLHIDLKHYIEYIIIVIIAISTLPIIIKFLK